MSKICHFFSFVFSAQSAAMFCDKTEITVQAGKGGDGLISFRREKFMPKGGPDGGDGGRGGDVIIRADAGLNSLIVLHTKKQFAAPAGVPGGDQRKTGGAGDDAVILVPVGTQVYDRKQGELMADLAVDGDEFIAAVGGRGGFGNAHFTSSIRQAPRFAELGEPGEFRELALELKLVADLGIIGLPSAGKSTLLAAISAARPKVGDFAFTTLIPNLGVAALSGGRSLVCCDLPGLIEGASEGKGLGHEFLRHVSRNRILLHLIDGNAADPVADYTVIREELRKYDPALAEKPEIIAFSKTDSFGDDPEMLTLIVQDFCRRTNIDPKTVFGISAVSNKGVKEVIERCYALNEAEKTKAAAAAPAPARAAVVFRPHLDQNPKAFEVIATETGWRVSGRRIEQIVVQSDFTNPEAVMRVRDVFRKMGIERELNRQGAVSGDQVLIGEKELRFEPELFGRSG